MVNNGLSIIICCYNSAARIEKTLQHIVAQVIGNINCEIILVDNASTDNTAEVAKIIWSNISVNNIKLNIFHEQTPGLAFARLKGVSCSAFEIVIFCDDDNWLDKNYIQNTYDLFIENPHVGIIGGTGTAEFEDPSHKPLWFDKFHHGYAVGQQAEKQGTTDNVYGAGMAIRKSLLINAIEKHPVFLHDRKGNHLSSGEDSEICARVRLGGYQILYSPQLSYKHFLPNTRLTWQYLKKLHIGFAKSHVILNLYQEALVSDNLKLPSFYWLKKTCYYWGIYFKYWFKHYKSYKKGDGMIEEIHHITWKHIALDYLRYNFKTIAIYSSILTFKRANNQPE